MDNFEKYIREFDYPSISAIKIGSKKLLELIKSDRAEVIDVRFKEEYNLWHVDFIRNIPINELPDRLPELDNAKIIVVVCPNETRSNIAVHFLLTRGFKAKFLVGGLIDLQQNLLGGQAKEFHNTLHLKS